MRYGHGQVLDGLVKDGLWDVYNDIHMVSRDGERPQRQRCGQQLAPAPLLARRSL
jgi:hypothetical protein